MQNLLGLGEENSNRKCMVTPVPLESQSAEVMGTPLTSSSKAKPTSCTNARIKYMACLLPGPCSEWLRAPRHFLGISG